MNPLTTREVIQIFTDLIRRVEDAQHLLDIEQWQEPADCLAGVRDQLNTCRSEIRGGRR